MAMTGSGWQMIIMLSYNYQVVQRPVIAISLQHFTASPIKVFITAPRYPVLERRRAASREGDRPNTRVYSRLNWVVLS